MFFMYKYVIQFTHLHRYAYYSLSFMHSIYLLVFYSSIYRIFTSSPLNTHYKHSSNSKPLLSPYDVPWAPYRHELSGSSQQLSRDVVISGITDKWIHKKPR